MESPQSMLRSLLQRFTETTSKIHCQLTEVIDIYLNLLMNKEYLSSVVFNVYLKKGSYRTNWNASQNDSNSIDKII